MIGFTMVYFPVPAGDPGRPSHRKWTLPFFTILIGHYAGSFITMLGAAYVLSGSDFHTGTLFRSTPFLCVSFPLFGYIFADITPFGRRWEQAINLRGTSLRYVFLVGCVSGSIAGLLILASTLSLPEQSHKIVNIALTVLGPSLGIWWLLHRREKLSDPEASHYDDMQSNENLSSVTTRDLATLAETESFGRRLGALLFPNAVISLIGPLGAGKTHLSRAIAEGLGIANPAAVTSPTFTLIHEYPARLPIFHFDAYRLSGPDAFLDLGATEYYQANGVCLIEWADRVEAALPPERLTIRLESVSESNRRAIVEASGERYRELLRNLAVPERGPSLT
jgi:tRNA threonylcarbamoyladenosine biosynthesis protein TsaE